MEPRPNRDALNVVQFNLDIIVDPSVVSFPMNTTNDDDFARNIQQFQVQQQQQQQQAVHSLMHGRTQAVQSGCCIVD
ncbi:hypothetical protein RP20_CCG004048 [Aedes albopictus]|nr:hypothetical protein RP20_CCG004048 [Aedes albopictus]